MDGQDDPMCGLLQTGLHPHFLHMAPSLNQGHKGNGGNWPKVSLHKGPFYFAPVGCSIPTQLLKVQLLSNLLVRPSPYFNMVFTPILVTLTNTEERKNAQSELT